MVNYSVAVCFEHVLQQSRSTTRRARIYRQRTQQLTAQCLSFRGMLLRR